MAIAYEYRPGVLYLNVTNRCSNDCVFCVRQGPGYSLAGVDMRLVREPDASEVLKAIADRERGRGRPFDEVVFCGFGEPTYRLDLIDEVGQALRRRGIPVRLNTNGQGALINGRQSGRGGADARNDGQGTGLDVDALVDVLARSVSTVSISLNAPDAEAYEALCEPRFGDEAFPALLALARRCVGRVENVMLTVVGFSLDDEAIDRCEDLARELGAEFRVR